MTAHPVSHLAKSCKKLPERSPLRITRIMLYGNNQTLCNQDMLLIKNDTAIAMSSSACLVGSRISAGVPQDTTRTQPTSWQHYALPRSYAIGF